jgi:hypothetical protein
MEEVRGTRVSEKAMSGPFGTEAKYSLVNALTVQVPPSTCRPEERGAFSASIHPARRSTPLMKIGSDCLSPASYPVPAFSRRTSLQSVWLQPLRSESRGIRGTDRHADQTTGT